MEKITRLLARQDALLAEIRVLADKENRTEEEGKTLQAKLTESDNIEAEIALEEKLSAKEAKAKAPENTPFRPAVQVVNEPQPKPFKNLVEQLRAVKMVATEGRVDPRLSQLNKIDQIQNAALGGQVGVGADGGFAVQTDFAGMMLHSAAKAGDILSRVDRYEVTDGSNSVKWVDIAETSVATTVFGGVQVYWAAEAGTATAKKPVLQEKELKLEKLMGLAYATYELEHDSSFVNDLYTRSFTLAIQRELEGNIVSGNGVGKPLGFLTGGALVTVAKESGQTAATIVWDNLSKMYNRTLDKGAAGLAWVMHPDGHEQLDFLSFPVGTGGVPVYLPATQQGALDTLRGKPIVESDHCSALGTAGDINLVDLSEYLLVYKGGVDAATSMHVQFLTAENCFRFIFRANGMPKKNNTLTIKNSSNARSSFVTLATRS